MKNANTHTDGMDTCVPVPDGGGSWNKGGTNGDAAAPADQGCMGLVHRSPTDPHLLRIDRRCPPRPDADTLDSLLAWHETLGGTDLDAGLGAAAQTAMFRVLGAEAATALGGDSLEIITLHVPFPLQAPRAAESTSRPAATLAPAPEGWLLSSPALRAHPAGICSHAVFANLPDGLALALVPALSPGIITEGSIPDRINFEEVKLPFKRVIPLPDHALRRFLDWHATLISTLAVGVALEAYRRFRTWMREHAVSPTAATYTGLSLELINTRLLVHAFARRLDTLPRQGFSMASAVSTRGMGTLLKVILRLESFMEDDPEMHALRQDLVRLQRYIHV